MRIQRLLPGLKLRRVFLVLWAACLASGLLLVLAPRASAAPVAPRVVEIRVDGIIDNIEAGYLERGLKWADSQGASLVIVTIDTPGGLDTSMRRMVQALLNSRVPTAVYVSPSGARAASAGVFIVAAGNVAAMAPGTNLGAAHPVDSSGGDLPSTLSEKATNDAAALIRGVAEQRGRNGQWLEDAVRRSVAASAQEAKDLGVIDVVASSRDDLLAQIDGRTVTTPQGEVTLQTAGLTVRGFQMNWPERFLSVIATPDLAFVLLALGGVGLVIEFIAPGHIVPGVVGGILLVLGLVALGSLPVNWAGVGLLALGVALLIVEVFTPGFGIFGIGGIIAFILGAFFMFTPFTPSAPALPEGGFRVSWWLLALTAMVLFVVFQFYLRAVLKARRAGPPPPPPIQAGALGVATTDLGPRGTVQAASELWTAEVVDDGTVQQGETVEVVALEGLVLKVRKAPQAKKPQGGVP